LPSRVPDPRNRSALPMSRFAGEERTSGAYSDCVEDSDRLAGGVIRVR
jgi:hypothetical protein